MSPKFQSPTNRELCKGGGRDRLCSLDYPISLDLCLAQSGSPINARGVHDCGTSTLTWVQILPCHMVIESL